MLLAALKMKLAVLVAVAGLDSNDMKDISPMMLLTLEALAADQQDTTKDINQSFNAALAKVRKLAQVGDKDANYALAHWGGVNCSNNNEIIELYRKASDQGQIQAKAELAKVLMQAGAQNGDSVREAIKLIKEAELADNKLARRMLANLHLYGVSESGNGVVVIEKSTAKARELLEKGNKAGDGEATLGLAQIYSAGVEGIPQDHRKALDYLFEACKQGDATAVSTYAIRLLNGDPNTSESPKLVRKDVALALTMLNNAAEKGIVAANYILGQIYENGIGPDSVDVNVDMMKAIKYYDKAAKGNDPQALFRLGNAYETGIIKDPKGRRDDNDNILILPNLKVALDYYCLSAQNNSVEALYNAGVYYETGTAVDKDPAKAYAFFSHAASAGVTQAQQRLAGLKQSGNGVAPRAATSTADNEMAPRALDAEDLRNATKRVALVIGVNTYHELPERMQLSSPRYDAIDVAAALKSLGYTLINDGAVTDASREVITDATEKFAKAARNSEAAVFYYSGHGIQVGDDNYILPSDTPNLTGLSMLKNRGVLLRDSVMVALEEAGAKTKIIILDCCRDNPFSAQLEQALSQVGKSIKTKSVGEISGYGPGFYLAFATSPGSTAADGNGERNSPFTAAMLKTMPSSVAKDIDFYFRDVKALLPDDQVSWTNHSIKGSFTLLPSGQPRQ